MKSKRITMSAEAVSRLEALWRAWEALRLDPATGMNVWWRDYADHMAILLSPDGRFAKAASSNQPGDPLPCKKPPKGFFPDVRSGASLKDRLFSW